MIESSAIDIPKQEISFPKLMVGSLSGIIVLMVSEYKGYGTGTLVKEGDGMLTVGCFSETWDMEHFTDYNGSVTLTNIKEPK